jgi:hypothetical protein
MNPPPLTPEQQAEKQKDTHRRRILAFRRLKADPDFKEFIQEGVFEDMARNLDAALKDKRTPAADLAMYRDQWHWAHQLVGLIDEELEKEEQRIAEELRQAEQARSGQPAESDS